MIQVLVSHEGKVLGRTVFDQAQIKIGRNPDNDVQIEDPSFSRYHAVIDRDGETYVLRDQHSLNGLTIKGRKVQDWVVNDGDEVKVGGYKLSFSLDTPGAAILSDLSLQHHEAAHVALGSTLAMNEARTEQRAKEQSSNLRAHLEVLKDGQKDHKRYLIENDVFLLGRGPHVDFDLQGQGLPAVCAVITRGFGGFSITNLTVRPNLVRVQGEPVPRRTWLEGKEVRVQIGANDFAFRTGPTPERCTPIAQRVQAIR